jgi:haloalkane dehalogenase
MIDAGDRLHLLENAAEGDAIPNDLPEVVLGADFLRQVGVLLGELIPQRLDLLEGHGVLNRHIGSTRPGRNGEAVAKWVYKNAQKRNDAEFELVEHQRLKAVRSSEGEALVLDENMFIEKMLPGVTQRTLSVDEMEEYRHPFLESGDGRWLTLQWPREVPLSGDPADVHDRIIAYYTWLNTASLPKLFIDADPGVFITWRVRKLVKNFPNQHHVVAKGLHFVQEDSPDEIGQAITGWLERI